MGRSIVMMMCGVALLGIAGCAKREPKAEQPRAEASKYPPPPANTKFAKIQQGMTEPQVSAILGVPDDSHAYVTGKAFIPYYYGADQSRFACYYRGQGRIIFSGGNQWGAGRGKVVQVEYDKNEDGIAGTK